MRVLFLSQLPGVAGRMLLISFEVDWQMMWLKLISWWSSSLVKWLETEQKFDLFV